MQERRYSEAKYQRTADGPLQSTWLPRIWRGIAEKERLSFILVWTKQSLIR
jgi:hypothetical protein